MTTFPESFPSSHETATPGVGVAELDPREVRVLHEAALDSYNTVKDMSHSEAFRVLGQVANEVAIQTPLLAGQLREMATHKSHKVLIVPIGLLGVELPPTPTRYLRPEENPILPDGVTRGLALGMMGVTPFGYTSQQPGNIINNVIALQSQTENRVQGASANSKDQLPTHTEDASYNLGGAITINGKELPYDFDLSPDWLTNQFLRNNGVPTFVSIPDLGKLSHKAYDNLQKPYFYNPTNPGQQEDGANEANVRNSLIYNNEFLRINAGGARVAAGAPPEAQEALDELLGLMDHSTHNLPSNAGDINIIDNRRVGHGRALPRPDQMPRWDGRDRWQQRVVAWDNPDSRLAYMVAPSITEPRLFVAQAALLAA